MLCGAFGRRSSYRVLVNRLPGLVGPSSRRAQRRSRHSRPIAEVSGPTSSASGQGRACRSIAGRASPRSAFRCRCTVSEDWLPFSHQAGLHGRVSGGGSARGRSRPLCRVAAAAALGKRARRAAGRTTQMGLLPLASLDFQLATYRTPLPPARPNASLQSCPLRPMPVVVPVRLGRLPVQVVVRSDAGLLPRCRRRLAVARPPLAASAVVDVFAAGLSTRPRTPDLQKSPLLSPAFPSISPGRAASHSSPTSPLIRPAAVHRRSLDQVSLLQLDEEAEEDVVAFDDTVRVKGVQHSESSLDPQCVYCLQPVVRCRAARD
jgi:hypothetical protein